MERTASIGGWKLIQNHDSWKYDGSFLAVKIDHLCKRAKNVVLNKQMQKKSSQLDYIVSRDVSHVFKWMKYLLWTGLTALFVHLRLLVFVNFVWLNNACVNHPVVSVPFFNSHTVPLRCSASSFTSSNHLVKSVSSTIFLTDPYHLMPVKIPVTCMNNISPTKHSIRQPLCSKQHTASFSLNRSPNECKSKWEDVIFTTINGPYRSHFIRTRSI